MILKFGLAVTLLFVALMWQSSSPPRPRLLGVAHMAVAVSNVDKARGFYKDFLGFEEPYDLKNADGSLAMTFIKINDQQYVELFPGYQAGEDRLRHISFYTDNAERLRQYLKAKGVTVPDKVNHVRIGNTSFNVKDPEGHTVEFTQYEAAGWTMREQGKFLGKQRISARMMHVGIIIGDVPAATKFYHDTLGLTEFWRGNARGTPRVCRLGQEPQRCGASGGKGEDGRFYGRVCPQPRDGQSDSGVDGGLRPDGIWHGRDHGGARP